MDVEQAQEARERRAVLNELGLSPDIHYYRVAIGKCPAPADGTRWEWTTVLSDGLLRPMTTFTDPAPWKWPEDVDVTVYGVHTSWLSTILAGATAAPTVWRYRPEGADPFILLRITARPAGTAAYLDQRWRPDGAWTLGLQGLDQHPVPVDITHAMDAWPMLEDISDQLRRGGAPRGPRRWRTQEQFLAQVLPIIRELAAAEGKAKAERVAQLLDDRHPLPTTSEASTAAERDPESLARQLRRVVRFLFGQTWEEFLATHR